MKKALIMALCFTLVAVMVVGGTLAFIVDTNVKGYSNIYTTGDISIALEEDVAVIGANGTVKNTATGALYEKVMPGDFLKKEVSVTNTGSNDAYVRVAVYMNNAGLINKAIDEVYENAPYNYDDAKMQAKYDEIFAGWGVNYTKVDEAGNSLGQRLTITGSDMPENVLHVDSLKTIDEYTIPCSQNWYENTSVVIKNGKFGGYYSQTMDKYEMIWVYYIRLDENESTTLFNGLNIPAEFTEEQLKMFDNLQIEVYADAIQVADSYDVATYDLRAADEFANAKAAFGALEAIHPILTMRNANAALVEDADDFAAALAAGQNVILTDDIAVDAEVDSNGKAANAFVVDKDSSAVVDLNGHNIEITAAPTANGSYSVFQVKGDLVLAGNGAVTVEHTGVDMGWNALSAVVSVEGGSVTVGEGVILNHKGGTAMAYGIDVNSTLGETVANIDGAVVNSAYIGIRLFNNNKTQQAIVNVNSGIIDGSRVDVWVQNPSASAVDKNGVVNFADEYAYELELQDASSYYGRMYNFTNRAVVADKTELKDALSNATASGATDVVVDAAGANIGDLNYGLNTSNVPAGTTVTISNAVVEGKSYGNAVDGTVVFDNCTFTNSGAYSIHFDAGSGNVVFNNCTLEGWCSFGSAIKSVEMNNCTIGGNAKYAMCRFYQPTTLNNCVIDCENAVLDDVYVDGISAVGGSVVTLVDCTVEFADLEAAENSKIVIDGAVKAESIDDAYVLYKNADWNN